MADSCAEGAGCTADGFWHAQAPNRAKTANREAKRRIETCPGAAFFPVIVRQGEIRFPSAPRAHFSGTRPCRPLETHFARKTLPPHQPPPLRELAQAPPHPKNTGCRREQELEWDNFRPRRAWIADRPNNLFLSDRRQAPRPFGCAISPISDRRDF